jgi:putative RNA 2'-phosphotransferase
MDARLTNLSKFLSYVLRHRPDSIGVTLHAQGWANLDDLLARAQVHGEEITREDVLSIVANNDKKRFQLSEDGTQIRAVQGHSTDQVNIQRKAQRPPAVLYHGTADRFWPSIQKKGLIPGHRHQVHLSPDVVTATAVGQRHGKVIVLKVDAATLHERGHRFEQAENGVWLTDQVPAWALSVE